MYLHKIIYSLVMGARWIAARLPGFPWRTFVIGLLARVLIMPFAVHSDMLHLYWASACIGEGQPVPLRLQTLLLVAHAAYVRLAMPLIPSASAWCNELAAFGPDVGSLAGWLTFINQPTIYRVLFVLKLPYLAFDLGCALLLYKLKANFNLWWLNPVPFFAIYVIGRHECIAIFFILLSVFLIERQHFGRGIWALGIAAAIRYYPLFLLPFYVLGIYANWKKRVTGIIIGMAPWAAINLFAWMIWEKIELVPLFAYPHDRYLLATKIPVATWDNVYIFPLMYFLLLLHRIYNQQHGLATWRRYNLIALLLLLATTYMGQAPHYWAWFIPWLAIVTGDDRRWSALHVMQIALLFVYSLIGGRATAGYLFGPIAPDFFWSLPSPIEIIEQSLSPELVISLAHTAFSAVTLWMAYLVFREMTEWPSHQVGKQGELLQD